LVVKPFDLPNKLSAKIILIIIFYPLVCGRITIKYLTYSKKIFKVTCINIQGSEAEIFLSEIKELIHRQFENLGNITGDFFLSLELLYATPYYNDQLISQLRQLIDNYAAKGDQILEYYATNLVADLEKLTSLLTTDLENLNLIKH